MHLSWSCFGLICLLLSPYSLLEWFDWLKECCSVLNLKAVSRSISLFLLCCYLACFALFFFVCVHSTVLFICLLSLLHLHVILYIHLLCLVLLVGMRHFDKITMYDMSEKCIFFQLGWSCLTDITYSYGRDVSLNVSS